MLPPSASRDKGLPMQSGGRRARTSHHNPVYTKWVWQNVFLVKVKGSPRHATGNLRHFWSTVRTGARLLCSYAASAVSPATGLSAIIFSSRFVRRLPST